MTCAATQVVQLTPTGRGAVASLAVSGPMAAQWVGDLFHRQRTVALDREPCNKILYGRWLSADVGEEVVVCRRDHNRFEIHCHGGEAAAQAIIASLVERGCDVVDWRDWVRQVFADPIAAAARIALADVPTERTAAILCDQYAGALRRAIDEVSSAIATNDVASARQLVDALLAQSAVGLHLVHPWRVVLAGRPNVGKSSLINALVGYSRAIVHPTPGTTRDVVTADTAIDGWPIELADTAGLHASDDPIESAGIQLARQRLARADLVVLVSDISQSWSLVDKELMATWPGAILVGNKSDLVERTSPSAEGQPMFPTSALTGQDVDRLALEIGRRLVAHPPAAGQAVPFLPRHVGTLERIRQALADGKTDAAGRMVAEFASDSDPGC